MPLDPRDHRESLWSLPTPSGFDWGPAVLVRPRSSRVVVYDDDDCSCSEVDCPGCLALCYEVSGGARFAVGREELRCLPETFSLDWVSCPPADEFVYVVAPTPGLSLHRLKVGHTRNLAQREKQYLTASPLMLFLGLWPGTRDDERQLKELFRFDRIGRSEVIEVPKPWAAIARAHCLVG